MKYIYLIVLAVLFNTTVYAQELDIDKLPAYNTEYHKGVNPYDNLTKAMAQAKKRDVNILMMVGGNWCKWCGTFDNLIEDNKKVQDALYGNYEVVRVYYGNGISKKGESLLKQFPPIKGTPHFYILSSDAKLLKSVDTTFLERGYGYNKKKVLRFLEDNKKNLTKQKGKK